MRIAFDGLSLEQAETLGLVLLSAKINYHLKMSDKGLALWVAKDTYDEAIQLIEEYRQENPEIRPAPDTPLTGYRKTWSGLWGMLVILAFHVAISSGPDVDTFRQVYGSSASHILNGEWYRSVTSLLLHASALHLLGNMVGIALFGTAVCSVTGWGLGWALILASGIGGNLMNAYLYQAHHISIGASTAIFGALGMLTAYQFLRKWRESGTWFKAVMPLAAGLALLGFLGSSKHTDIMGHLFGFVAGILLGLLYTWSFKRPPRESYQLGALILVTGCLIQRKS